MTKILFTLFISILSINNVFSQNQIWLDRISNFGNSYGFSIVSDITGNVCITGQYDIPSSSTMIAVKYSSTGSRMWTFQGNSGSIGLDLKTDSIGNYYIVGHDNNGIGTWKISPSGTLLWKRRVQFQPIEFDFSDFVLNIDKKLNVYSTGLLGNKTVLVKYNEVGRELWVKTFGGNYNTNFPYEIITDDSLNIYLACNLNNQYSVIKFNSQGDSLWCIQETDIGDHGEARSLKIDKNYLFVTGTVYVLNYGNEMLTVKYNLNGETLWRQRFRDQNYHRNIGNNLILDDSLNCIITGESDRNFITMKYDSSGSLLWFNKYSGGPMNVGMSIVMDSLGFIYSTGFGNIISNVMNSDYITMKYSRGGSLMWLSRYDGPGATDAAQSIAIDKIGGVYVTGVSYGANNYQNIVTIKYSATTGTYSNGIEFPLNFSLSQNYPNPFNPLTRINYELQITNYVTLTVYDVNGRLVKELVNKKQSAGSYEVNFDGSGLPSGTYIYRLQAGDFSETKKMVLLK